MNDGALLILLVIFLLLAALFAASETALFAMPRARLRRLAGRKDILSDVFRQVLEKPHRVMVSILLGNTLAGVAAVSVSVLLTERWLGASLPLPVTLLIQLLVMSFILLVFGEVAPKTHALEHWETSTQRLAFFVRLASTLLGPFARALEGLAHGATRLFAGGISGGASLEDLRNLIEEAQRKGTLSPEESRLFSGAFYLRQLSASDVMTERADLVTAPIESSCADLVELVNATGHSRIPIYKKTIDHIVGVVFSADLLPQVLEAGANGTARSVMKPPILVPPSRSLEELLLNMQRQRLQLVVVAKATGETLGIVTMEDIVEEIVGDIQSEFEEEEAAVRLLEDGTAVVQANVKVSDINRLLGTTLPSDNGGTVEGLVRSLWHEPPNEGEGQDTSTGDRVTIETMVGTRVWSVRVRPQARGESQ